jgi:hypothetical protein
MTTKRIRLPKEELVDPRQRTPGEQFIDISDDVQGHGFALPAPPAILPRGAGHGGEAVPTEDEAEDRTR